MVLGKLPVPGRPTIWITVGQGPTALAVDAGGVVWTFLLSSILSYFPLSPSLWETARYRLKYCLKGSLNPKPTNQIRGVSFVDASVSHVLCLCAWYIAARSPVTAVHCASFSLLVLNLKIVSLVSWFRK